VYPFRYHRPQTLAEAAEIFAASEDPRWLAGGMTLLPAMKLRLAAPGDLIDLAALRELEGCMADEQGVTIGAMTRHADVAGSGAVAQRLPALAALAQGIGDTQVRHRGTIGGSISNNDPAADYPAAVLGLGATVVTSRRSIAAADFFLGLFETALQVGEIVTAVRFPRPERAAYVKFANAASRYAIVGAWVARMQDGGVRVAITGAGHCVFRVAAMERALERDFAPLALDGIEVEPDGLNGDLHASAEYRAHLISVMAKRAVAMALH
jgi:aerobic carbon-monoxide dehydrogenase medium subunit